MLLREEHLARWAVGGPPLLHLALQRAQLAVLKTPRIDPLQMLKYGLRLESRTVLQQPANRFPDLGEWVGPRTPTLPGLQLARQSTKAPILPRRLCVHPRLGRRQLQISLYLYQRNSPPYLPVRDQPASSKARNRFNHVVVGREF